MANSNENDPDAYPNPMREHRFRLVAALATWPIAPVLNARRVRAIRVPCAEEPLMPRYHSSQTIGAWSLASPVPFKSATV